MSKFAKICILDISSLPEERIQEVQKMSSAPIVYLKQHKGSSEQTAKLIGDADAVLISLLVDLPKEALEQCSKLKYIGVYGSSKRRIDLDYCSTKNIKVAAVESYCDFETAEFILAQMLMFARGLADRKWKDQARSLAGKTIGLIGLGKVATELAKLCLAFKMNVLYFDLRRKKEVEALGVAYTRKLQLIAQSDFVSLHCPPNTEVLGEDEFSKFKEGAVLVNTCPGKVFDPVAFDKWMAQGKNQAIFDRFVVQNIDQISDRVILTSQQAYRTKESIDRLAQEFLTNLGSG